MHRADGLIRCGLALLPGELGNAEVHDLNGAVREHHNILRLDIPVYDPSAVGMLQRPEDLQNKVHGILPTEHLFVLHVLLQGDPVNVLHYNVLDLVRESHIVDLDDIRMGQHCNGFGFVPEPAEEFLVLCKFLFEDLDRYGFVIHHVSGLVHVRHAADADQLRNFIPAVQLLTNVLIHLLLSYSI